MRVTFILLMPRIEMVSIHNHRLYYVFQTNLFTIRRKQHKELDQLFKL